MPEMSVEKMKKKEENDEYLKGNGKESNKRKRIELGIEQRNGNGEDRRIDLGNGSEIIYKPRLFGYTEAWDWFEYLNNEIPWSRPTLRIFGRACLQPRDTCYVASDGLPNLVYSGYQPKPYSWNDFPRLNLLLHIVEEAVPGSRFNSLLLNRYNGGNDYVAWHSDDESIYGPTPQIASLSFGCNRHFYLKLKKPTTTRVKDNSASKAAPSKKTKQEEEQQHSLMLKHGSLLVMSGYTQRDWLHSVPKRAKLDAVRINLTFRLIL